MYVLWKKLPVKYRNAVHLILHRFNSSNFLLKMFHFRHSNTVRKLKKMTNPVNLRLGESRQFEGWVSTNYQVITRHFLDATRFYGKEVCQYIFADNVIEHIDRNAGAKLFESSFNALKPGGILRLATPDLEEVSKRYLSRLNTDLKDFARDMEPHGLDIQAHPDLLRITFTAFGHDKGFIYDFSTLKSQLEKAGFQYVTKFQPGKSLTPALMDLETRVGKSDLWSQMAIEATKPI
jgi:predicted SAM-dependent methyltransferase